MRAQSRLLRFTMTRRLLKLEHVALVAAGEHFDTHDGKIGSVLDLALLI